MCILNKSYIARLMRIGVPIHDAYVLIFDFIKHYGTTELERFISDLERDAYVGNVQS